MNRFFLWLSAPLIAISSASAQTVLTNTSSAVKDKVDDLTDYAIQVFDGVTPVILAVVGLGILLVFAKRIKKS